MSGVVVMLIAGTQYSALLDLSFSLGYRTDALARLRSQYGFAYVDPSSRARPRPVDQEGRWTLTDSRQSRLQALASLGLAGEPARAAILAAYRRAAAATHPDRFHPDGEIAEREALQRFLRVVQAAESLLDAARD